MAQEKPIVWDGDAELVEIDGNPIPAGGASRLYPRP